MSSASTAWLVSAGAIIALSIGLGFVVKAERGPLGILIDSRGRFSLTHLQLLLWITIITSLFSGIFFGRLFSGVPAPLNFVIPTSVLTLLGISGGSAAITTAVKAAKDIQEPTRISASDKWIDKPRFSQVFLEEAGTYADRVIDATKFQNFIFTIVLAAAYVATAIAVVSTPDAASVTSLPDLPASFLTALGISHAAYAAGKLPPAGGDSPGLTVANRMAVVMENQPLSDPRNEPS